MLLKLEANGFKNLVNFDVSFGPFTCIAGENGVGKSNVFDAIQFLSLIADRSLLEAAQEVRSTRRDGAGDALSLFTVGLGPRMQLAVEVIVPNMVDDDFGSRVEPSITLLRYEVALGYELPTSTSRHGRLVVHEEDLRHINIGDAHKHLRFPHAARDFRQAVVTGRRSGGKFISTDREKRRILVHQDGGSRGLPVSGPPIGAQTTVVSSINSESQPTILALRREMQSWRRLALEPSALRAPDTYQDPQSMGSDGRHLAAALHRIATAGESADDVYARVAARLSGLAGVDVRGLRVEVDDVRELLSIKVTDRQGHAFPARSLSEGTLRYLALCILLEDPTFTGLVAMEEPENGIHPANLGEVIRLVEDLAVDPKIPPGSDNPLRQVIVNTHSPGVVQLVSPDDLLVATERSTDVAGYRVKALRLRGLKGSWRASPGELAVTRADLLAYLVNPPGAQISLFSVA